MIRPILALGTAALLVAGCGKADDPTPTVAVAAPSSTVERTTRVEVVKRLGADGHPAGRDAFDPAGIYDRDSPGIVTVLSAGLPGANGKGEGGAGLGSGFVVSEGGEIATNAHVVTSGEGKAITAAKRVYVKFRDGNQVPAKIVGFDPFADVALLRVEPTGLKLHALSLGTTNELVVGAPVVAIGSPFAEEQSLSVGVISATQRSIQSLTGFATSGAIQTDAAINPGNSGGPLLAADGAVLGINSQIRTESGDGSGVGFAVGVDAVKRSLDQLRATGKVHYAYLGVSSQTLFPQLVDEFDLGAKRGAWVQTVADDGPAKAAGIRAGSDRRVFQDQRYQVGGDVIVQVDGHAIADDDDLADALVDKAPGDGATVTLVRDGKRSTVRVTLGERPVEAPPRP